MRRTTLRLLGVLLALLLCIALTAPGVSCKDISRGGADGAQRGSLKDKIKKKRKGKKKKKKGKKKKQQQQDEQQQEEAGESGHANSERAKKVARRREQAAERAATWEQHVESRLESSRAANERRAKKARNYRKALHAFQRQQHVAAMKLRHKKHTISNTKHLAKGLEKLEWMREQAEASGTGMIKLRTADFKKYVASGPRPYHTVVTMTALGKQHNCAPCRMVHKQEKDLALSYVEQREHAFQAIAERMEEVKANNAERKRTVDPEIYHEDNPEEVWFHDQTEKPIFMVIVDAGDNQDLFNRMRLNGIPQIFMAPSTMNPRDRSISSLLSKLPERYRFTSIGYDLKGQDIAAWVYKGTGVSVEVAQSIPKAQLIGYLVLGVIMLVVAVWQAHRLKRMRTWTLLFTVLGWCMVAFCLGGHMYNRLRHTPWSGDDTWIARSPRDQYQLESIVMGSLQIGMGVVVALLYRFSWDVDTSGKENYDVVVIGGEHDPLSAKQYRNKLCGGLVKSITGWEGWKWLLSPGILLLIAVWMWYQLVSVYSEKSWGYDKGWVWGRM